jgi:hypothetical protein
MDSVSLIILVTGTGAGSVIGVITGVMIVVTVCVDIIV